MALETVVNINDLVDTNPTFSDAKSFGDDHLRNIKKVVKQAFAGFTGAVLITGTDGGLVNAYTLTPATPLLGYGTRMIALFSPNIINSGPVTLNVSGLGAKAVVSNSGAALVANDLIPGRIYAATYNGTAFMLNAVTQNYVDQLVVAGTVPGVNDPANAGKFFATDGATGTWQSADLMGSPMIAKPASGTVAQVFNYAQGDGQTLTATGAFSFTATGFPAGRMGGILIMATNWGAHAITSTGITWFKADGTTTNNFNTSGITLPTAGIGTIVLWSLGNGVIYGKAA